MRIKEKKSYQHRYSQALPKCQIQPGNSQCTEQDTASVQPLYTAGWDSTNHMDHPMGRSWGGEGQTSLKDRHPRAVPETSWSCASEAAHTASSQKCSPRISSREGLFPHTHISQHCSAPPELLHQDEVLLLSYGWKQGALPTTCPRRGLVQRKSVSIKHLGPLQHLGTLSDHT